MRRIGDLKRAAKTALKGNYGILIMASMIGSVLSFFGTTLTTALFPGDSVLSIVLSQLFAIILSLVFSIVTAGYSYMLLKVAREGSCVLGDLFYFFRSHPDRVIVASTVLAVIDVVATFPATYYNLAVEPGTSMEAQMEWLTTYSVIFLVTSILSMLLGIPFAMIYFLLSDNEEMGGIQAVKESARMMKGRIGKYLLLQISFFPLMLLSVFTFYIALLWVMPYMQMSAAMFYRDMLGELDRPIQGAGFYSAYTMGGQAETPELSETQELPEPLELPEASEQQKEQRDDYNSEA